MGRFLDFYSKKNTWKTLLIIFAFLIGIGTLWYTESFLSELRKEEVKRVELWAEAIHKIIESDADAELGLAIHVIQSNTTIPIILTDGEGSIQTHRNIRDTRPEALQRELERMKREREPIEIVLDDEQKNYIYYRNSHLLTQLRVYPLVLLLVIAIFISIAYTAFSGARRSEQNRIWSGMAKETAHQIGTPLSSLMGWIEILKTQDADPAIAKEMEKDIQRLNVITDRFSKIGSIPDIKPENISELTEHTVDYLNARTSKKIDIRYFNRLEENKNPKVPLNKPLVGWVIENLVKNGVDALEGGGTIDVTLKDDGKFIALDVRDSGKGLPKKMYKTIFRPGYTTKTRGWGLGLSLARRIIEDYHNGKINIVHSSPGEGTTFRVLLRKEL